MALRRIDNIAGVGFETTSTGTGALAVGAAMPRMRVPPAALDDGVAQGWYIRHADAGTDEWEIVEGLYDDVAGAISRDTVIAGSAGPGTNVNFSTGRKYVVSTPLPGDWGALAALDDTGAALSALPTSGTATLDFSSPVDARYPVLTATGAVTFAIGASPRDGAVVRLRFIPHAGGTSFPVGAFQLEGYADNIEAPDTYLNWAAGGTYTLELHYDAQIGKALIRRFPIEVEVDLPTRSIPGYKLADALTPGEWTGPTDLTTPVARFYNDHTQSGSLTVSVSGTPVPGAVAVVAVTGNGSAITWSGISAAPGETLPSSIANGTTKQVTIWRGNGTTFARVSPSDSGTDDQTAAEVPVTLSPTNYSTGASGGNAEGHFEGIDTALGSITLGGLSDHDADGSAIVDYTQPHVTGVSGTLTQAAHGGRPILITGTVTVPVTDGFTALLRNKSASAQTVQPASGNLIHEGSTKASISLPDNREVSVHSDGTDVWVAGALS